jgi:glucosamine 6-phosphate synthetase-like amidotransferase/phosphosugar isomerase protein
MLKEIFEQPNTVRDAMRGRLNTEECTAKLGGLNMTAAQLRDVGRIVLTGCGTALHAARVGRILIERMASIPTEVDYASEFRHRNTPMTRRHAGLRHQPERRNRGHARRVARKPAQRISHPRNLQQRRQHDRA